MLGKADQPEVIEHQRRHHLPADHRGNQRPGAEPRRQHDGARDVDRAKQAAAPLPPGRLRPRRGDGDRNPERQDGDQQTRRFRRRTTRRRRQRIAEKCPELGVHAGLDWQQGADDDPAKAEVRRYPAGSKV